MTREDFNKIDSRYRTTGRTTRLIDNMVQKFFEKGHVEMIPHDNSREDMIRGKDLETLFVDGYSYNDNVLTFYKFLNRLEIEHKISIRNKNLKVKGLKAILINQTN